MIGNGHVRYAKVRGVVAPPDPAALHRALESRYARLVREGSEIAAPYVWAWDAYRDSDPLLGPNWWAAGWNAVPRDRLQRHDRGPDQAFTEVGWRGQLLAARTLCERNHVALGFLEHVTNFVVGPGTTVRFARRHPAPDAATGQGTDPLVDACQRAWDDWREANDWGCGEEDRRAEAHKRLVRDGEAWLRFFDGGGCPVRFVEPEQVRTPPGQDNTGPWGWGVYREDDGETDIAYWVADPDAGGSRGDWADAGDVVRAKGNTDRSERRGVSDFTPVAGDLGRVRRLLENMGEVAAVQSALAFVTTYGAATLEQQVTALIAKTTDLSVPRVSPVNTQGPGNPLANVRMFDPGTQLHFSNGIQFTAGPVSSGATQFVAVEQAMLRAIGMRWSCPEYFSGDGSNANFASTLVAGAPFVRATERRQAKFCAFECRVAMRVIEGAERAGRLPPGAAEAVKATSTPAAVAIANKAEETNRRKVLSDAGVLDPITWMEQEGLDPKVIEARLREWREKFPQKQQPGGPDDAGGFGGGGGEPPSPTSPGGGDFADEFAADVVAEAYSARVGEAGYTGVVTDKRGRKYRYVNGVRVAKPAGVTPAKRATAAPAAGSAAKSAGPDLTDDEWKAVAKKLGTDVGSAKKLLAKFSAEPDAAPAKPAVSAKARAWGESQAEAHAPAAAEHLGTDAATAKKLLGDAIGKALAEAAEKGTGIVVVDAPDGSGRKLRVTVRRKRKAAAESGGGEAADEYECGLSFDGPAAESGPVAEGFTGRRTDSLGRGRCYSDGKPVPCHTTGHEHAAHHARAQAGELLRNPWKATPEDFADLAHHLRSLTVPELKQLAKDFGAAHGGQVKRERVDALLSWAKVAAEPKPMPDRSKGPGPGTAAVVHGGITGRRAARPRTRPEPKAAPWHEGGAAPDFGAVYNAPTDALHVDPARMQFKLDTDAVTGVTAELKSVRTWNPDFAGVVSVWKDPADGKTYVVNGHHRRELAGRLGVPELAVRYVRADTAKEARAVGALVNIAEGRGTAVDAAKFLRDTGIDPADLEAKGVSLHGRLAEDAGALRSLSDRTFDRLARGDLDVPKALAVARNLTDPAKQDQLFKLLDAREEKGKDLPLRVVEEMAREMADTPTTTRTDSTLFGDIESEESLFVPRNELKAAVRADLARETNDFAAVASARRAGRVGAAGNVLNVTANKELADAAGQAARTFDLLANRRGPISDALNDQAAKYAKATTRRERDEIRRDTAERVRAAVRAELGET